MSDSPLSVNIGIGDLDTILAIMEDLQMRLEKDIAEERETKPPNYYSLNELRHGVLVELMKRLEEKKKKMWDDYFEPKRKPIADDDPFDFDLECPF